MDSLHYDLRALCIVIIRIYSITCIVLAGRVSMLKFRTSTVPKTNSPVSLPVISVLAMKRF